MSVCLMISTIAKHDSLRVYDILCQFGVWYDRSSSTEEKNETLFLRDRNREGDLNRSGRELVIMEEEKEVKKK